MAAWIGKWRTPAIVAVLAAALWWAMSQGWGGGGGIVKADSAAAATTAAASNTVTVGAEGKIKVEPDVAYLSVAVESRGATASEAQKSNATAFAAVEKALLDKFGVAAKDIQTTGFYVQPEYNYTEKDGRKLVGYTAVHQLQITYRKLAEVGKLLDALSAAGANRMDGVQYGTEKKEQYELDALRKAMANADAKAGVLATSAKRTLGGVLNIVQGDVRDIPVVVAAEQLQMKSASDAGGASSSLQAGQIEISASVTVQYALK